VYTQVGIQWKYSGLAHSPFPVESSFVCFDTTVEKSNDYMYFTNIIYFSNLELQQGLYLSFSSPSVAHTFYYHLQTLPLRWCCKGSKVVIYLIKRYDPEY